MKLLPTTFNLKLTKTEVDLLSKELAHVFPADQPEIEAEARAAFPSLVTLANLIDHPSVEGASEG